MPLPLKTLSLTPSSSGGQAFELDFGSGSFDIEQAETLFHTAAKIRSYAKLPVGWCYGKGGPISEPVREIALNLQHIAMSLGLIKTDAVPSVNGSIAIAVAFEKDFLEFVVQPDLTVDFQYDAEDEEVASEEGLTPEEAYSRLVEFAAHQWNSFGSSTRGTFTHILSASEARHLRTHLMDQESLSLEATAYLNLDTQSASTFDNITRLWSESRRSFGDSTSTHFLKVAA